MTDFYSVGGPSIVGGLYMRKLLTGFLLFLCVGVAVGKPILDYSGVDLAVSGQLPVPPKSVFHGWEEADAEAEKILLAWKVEPITIPWTRVQLERHIKHKVSPTRAARGLALVHAAMYDAYELAKERKAEPRLVVSMAAAQVLAYLFNAEERLFDRIAFALASRITESTPQTLPPQSLRDLQLGKAIGEHVVRYGDTDGAQRGWNGVRLQWYGEGRYYGPGAWEPTPPYFYYPPDEPFAPTWRTWVLASASTFRPTPPLYGSEKYMKDLREVVAVNASLTEEQRKIALFWVDGHGSVTPAGHWNQIAIQQTLKAKLGDEKTAKLFAELNIAQADAFIATWDAKYHYWTVRPVTASQLLLGVELRTAILTPPFPSYVSGHAAFSGAASHILAAYFPDQADRLREMGEQAAMSRLLGGIHFRHDNEDGLSLGRKVADKVLEKYRLSN